MKNLYQNLPDTPGVYLMKDSAGELLYVGKAGNLKRRVSSYFLRPHSTPRSDSGRASSGQAHDRRIEKLVSRIAKVEYKKTDSALEALILEAELIKEKSPLFNIKEKDNKSFLYFEITKEKFPRVLLVRGRDEGSGARYGPFTSASSAREALKILRRIFPWNTHADPKLRITSESTKRKNSRRSNKFASFELDSYRSHRANKRPCFNYEIGLCPGTCVGTITKQEYAETVKNLKLFLEGKKKKVLKNLEKEMAAASKHLEFEKAEKFRRQIFALSHIRDVALITDDTQLTTNDLRRMRIEGYDISNISGTSAVGSMVVFTNGEPDKDEYRKFRIKTVVGSNPARRHLLSVAGGDVGMLKEMLRRRFLRNHYSLIRANKRISSTDAENKKSWPLPNLILIDGGRGQVNGAKSILLEVGLKIPVIGIAKGAKRKRNDIIGFVPKWTDKKTLVRVRDEAHRFAIIYHKKVRGREFLG